MNRATQVVPRRLGANLLALAASQAGTWAMALAWTLVVPRILGPAGMGILVTASSATAVVSVVLGLGARDFLVREIAADRSRGLDLAGTTVTLRACLIPIYLGVLTLYAAVAHFGSETTEVLSLAAAVTICAMIAEPLPGTFQGLRRRAILANGTCSDRRTRSSLP